MTTTRGWIPSRTEMETSAHLETHTPKRFPKLTFSQRTAFTDGWCNAILILHRIVGAELAPRVERDSKAGW